MALLLTHSGDFIKLSRIVSAVFRALPMEPKQAGAVLSLTKRQQDSLVNMWASLEPDMEAIGVEVFQRILQLCPEAIRMFYFGQNVQSSEDILRNKEFRFHGLRFMEVIIRVAPKTRSE